MNQSTKQYYHDGQGLSQTIETDNHHDRVLYRLRALTASIKRHAGKLTVAVGLTIAVGSSALADNIIMGDGNVVGNQNRVGNQYYDTGPKYTGTVIAPTGPSNFAFGDGATMPNGTEYTFVQNNERRNNAMRQLDRPCFPFCGK